MNDLQENERYNTAILAKKTYWRRLEDSRELIDSALIDFRKAIIDNDFDLLNDALGVISAEINSAGQSYFLLKKIVEENDDD